MCFFWKIILSVNPQRLLMQQSVRVPSELDALRNYAKSYAFHYVNIGTLTC